MKILLDTHVVDWASHRDPRLSTKAHDLIAAAGPGELVISDITLTELARHLATGSISTPMSPERWLEQATANLEVLPVTREIALYAAFLDWTVAGKPHRDPCDRHIVATAVKHRLSLLTIDEKMHDLVGVRGLKTIW